MPDPKVNLIHALNHCLFMHCIKFSEPVLYQHESHWDELIFSEDLLIKKADRLADLLGITGEAVRKNYETVLRAFQNCDTEGVLILTIRDPLYPTLLMEVKRPPLVLYLRGDVSLFNSYCVAVVGTREPTDEGIKRAQKIAMELVGSGITVVAGLAKGIDTAAHMAAIRASGRTIAVIGTPINITYPAENSHLQELIADNHLIVSQFVLGQPVRTWNFPKRNAIMVGISSATVIVEARVHGGGPKIQGSFCLKAGRKLFIMRSFVSDAVPWTKEFVKQGAISLPDVETLFSELNYSQQAKHPAVARIMQAPFVQAE